MGSSSTSQAHAYVGNGTSAHLGQVPSKYGDTLAPDWTPPNPHQLEGPGMPLQRSNSSSLGMQQVDGVLAKGAVASGAADVGDAMDADEVEDERYCFCGGVSYGEMIACDDDNCEREWVRFLIIFIFISFG